MKSILSWRSILLIVVAASTGCARSSFLDKKPNTQLVVPAMLDDFQALLDNEIVMQETPELGELSSDNLYINYNVWLGLVAKEQNAYTFAKDIYNGLGQVADWDLPYKQVFYANVILDGLTKVKADASDQKRWNTLKGTALFIRAYAFYNLSQIFAPVYEPTTASGEMGIALRLSPDVNIRSVRASVQQTYDQILGDLREADSLLPAEVPTQNLNRPSRPAALAMLARVCLSMRAYDQAETYSNASLLLYDSLMDYKSLAYGFTYPVKKTNKETLYQSVMLTTSGLLVGALKANCIIDSNLYRSYAKGDLRTSVYFRLSGGVPYLKGSYNGTAYCFSGLAVDEVYLTRAECRARLGNKEGALADLNELLKHRWVKNDSIPFQPVVASSAAAALDSVLIERRKELVFRGIRWTDIRRLNKEGANYTIRHSLNGQVYQLSPTSPNYIFPLPPDVKILSGMPDFDNRIGP